MGVFSLQLPGELAELRAKMLVGARDKPLPLALPPVDALLPDGGLPRGAVVELCSLDGLGGATRLGLAACASAQHEARKRETRQHAAREDSEHGWCAWIDASASLFAPGVVSAGVDLRHLLVVRPPADAVARIAVRVAASQIFAVVVVDRCGVPGAEVAASSVRWSLVARRLALSIEGSDTTVILLSNRRKTSAEILPVAMRIELGRNRFDRMSVRIAKERHGRLSGPHSVPLLLP